ncbi:MAG: tRNA-(ms[2]io[6]A)-hydroxylase [Gammaproteobacteria bacterium]|nr:tRNA-(ms[2]io[6]A)-hydroxylase [Gammaproteobacteria bacterium]
MKPDLQAANTQVTLLCASSEHWLDAVLNDFDAFLVDHAACERKAAAVATSMICHYPDREKLVAVMADLAVEEMSHFREVVRLIHKRGIALSADRKDPYVNALRKQIKNGREAYLLDRLLIASIVEARGTERFAMIGAALSDEDLRKFYRQLARSEARHQQVFFDLALRYLPHDLVLSRLGELQIIEAEIIESLPFRAALH